MSFSHLFLAFPMATLETGDSFEPGELRESGGGGGGYEEIEYDVEEDLEGDLSQENGVNEAFVKLANGKTPTKTLSQKTLCMYRPHLFETSLKI